MRRDRGGLEHAVLSILADGRSRSVTEVLAALGGDLAHTTVMTVLSRLADKGALLRERDGRSYRYQLAGSARVVSGLQAALRMRRTLDAEPDRADVLANFVAGLAPDDEEMLRELLLRNESDWNRE